MCLCVLFPFRSKPIMRSQRVCLHLWDNCQKVCQWGAQYDCSPVGHLWTWTWSTFIPVLLDQAHAGDRFSRNKWLYLFLFFNVPCNAHVWLKKKRKQNIQRECRQGVLKTNSYRHVCMEQLKKQLKTVLTLTEISFSLHHLCFWLWPRSLRFTYI